MTDGELIAALAQEGISPDLLMKVAARLNRKASKDTEPTPEEVEMFERLWKVRQQFTRRPGDPKKPALLKFVREMRKKPVSFEEIEYGIRCEYSTKRSDPSCYAQMETFMGQRRWETYDFAGYQRMREQREAVARASNVTPIRKPEPIDTEARRRHGERVLAQLKFRAVGE